MDPDAARPQLPPIEHQVIRLAAHGHRIGFEPVQVVGMRMGERVVRGLRPSVLGQADEHREVDDPDVPVRALVHGRAREVVAELAEHVTGRHPLVGHQQENVPFGSAHHLGERALLVVAQEPRQR